MLLEKSILEVPGIKNVPVLDNTKKEYQYCPILGYFYGLEHNSTVQRLPILEHMYVPVLPDTQVLVSETSKVYFLHVINYKLLMLRQFYSIYSFSQIVWKIVMFGIYFPLP